MFSRDSFFLICFLPTFLFGGLKAIVLVNHSSELLNTEELEQAEGIDVNRICLPGSLRALEAVLSPFCCDDDLEFDSETPKKVKQAIYCYYQDQGFPFVIISVPTQNYDFKVLQLVVEESHVDKVEVQGNCWVKDRQIERYIGVKQGDPISVRELNRDVDFINRNPFRRVDVVYSPGDEKNTTNLTLQVQDTKPYRFYAGMDNTGVPTTERQRVFAGFSWDQVFGLDHTFFYQYSTGFRVRNFHANTFQYLISLPSKTQLDLYGGFSTVRARIPTPNRSNKGSNIQASIRYHMPTLPWQFYSQEITVGFDIKNTNNTMEFVDYFTTVGQTVNLTQWMVGYKGRYEKGDKSVEGGVEAVFSPFQWLPDQSEADFSTLRVNADNRWVYINAYLKGRQALPYKMALLYTLRFQWTPFVLLPSEQLGMGGLASVRGYDERQYNADTGALWSFEYLLPPFSIFRSKLPNRDQMYFLLFFEGGGGYDVKPIPEVNQANFLLSVGPGVRYAFGRFLSARLDWGFKLHHQADFTGGFSMLQFSFTASY